MPPTVADILPRLRAVCLDGATHPDYSLTVARATEYRRFATGKDLEKEMVRFAAQETPEQFDSRVRMWVKVVPAWWEQGRKPFYEVARLGGGTVTKRFDYPDEVPVNEATRLRQRLIGAVDHFYQLKPLERYLAERLAKSHCMSDPNAWLLTQFQSFDYRTEIPQPYPVLVPCEAAVDFQRLAGVTTYFTARFSIPQATDHFRYVCWLANEAVDCWPVLWNGNTPTYTLPEGAAPSFSFRETTPDGSEGKELYQCRVLAHKAGRVPAKALGYVVDEEGTGETFVSPLHAGMPFLKQMLKTGSENDIVGAQMATPIRVMYSRPCPGSMNELGQRLACNNGKLMPDMTTCGTCGGTGQQDVPLTAARTMTLPYPELGETANNAPKPADFMAFLGPSVDLPKYQLDYLDRGGKFFMQTIFGNYDGERTAGGKTATEDQLDKQSELTALAPFADQFAALYVDAASVCAGYTDAGTPQVVYEFPADLERVSLDDLFAQRKVAVDAGADSNALEALDAQIAIKQFAGDPQALVKNQVKRRFMTYLGMSLEEVNALYALGGISKENWLLRTSADIIFGELEIEVPEFYLLAYNAQNEKVTEKVQKLLSGLPSPAASMPRLDLSPTTSAVGASA